MRVVFHLADRITVLDRGHAAGRGHARGDRRQRSRAGRLSGESRMNALDAPRAATPTTARATSCTTSTSTSPRARSPTLLGRNGAGKTTTLRSLVGLTPPRAGRVTIFGKDTTALAALPHRRARRRLRAGRPPHLRQPDGRGESARCRWNGPGPWTIERIYELFPRLARAQQTTAAASSRAASRRCCRSRRALLLNPQAADPRRAVAGPGAADRARGVPHRRADARGRHLGAAGRAERAHEPGRSPTTPMCSTTAASSIPARRGNSPPTKRGSRRSPAPVRRSGRNSSSRAD